MILPSVEVVVRLADHASLTDEQLGQVIRSRSRLRKYLHQLGEKKRQEQKRQKRAEAVSRNREAIRERLLARQQKKDEMVAREVEIEEKENYLIEQERLRDERERLERLEKILEKGLSQ
jgi:transposase